MLGPDEPDAQAFVHGAAALGMDLRIVTHADPALLALYEATFVLIRPDQIVAWRGANAAHAQAVLSRANGAPPAEP